MKEKHLTHWRKMQTNAWWLIALLDAPLICSESVVLLLSIILKHKPTREAFSGFPSVIDAHAFDQISDG